MKLPDGWEKIKIKNAATVKTGPFGAQLHQSDYVEENGTPIITVEHLSERGLIHENLPLVSDIDKKRLKRYILNENDIVFSRVGSVDRSSLVAKDEDGWMFSGRLLRIQPDKTKINSPYLIHFFHTNKFRHRIRSLAVGGTMPSLNTPILSNVKIVLPPLPEQKAIADLLSTWDEAIEKTERLIQAKEKQLKRLQNDLIYVPTVEGKWKQIRTKSLFKERKETKRDDLPLLSITNGEGVIPREDTNRKDISNEDKSKYLRICPGDIGYNTMRMWQGVSALSSLEGIVSPAYTICIPGENLYPSFVAYLFKMPFMIHRFYRYSQGLTSDTWNLKYPHFGEVKMPIPSLEEQKTIAETLSTAQHEIDLLKQLAEKYKTQKRGLMQKMLTGEWRVKDEIISKYRET